MHKTPERPSNQSLVTRTLKSLGIAAGAGRAANSGNKDYFPLKDTSVNIATAFRLAHITSETIGRNKRISPREIREMERVSPSAVHTGGLFGHNLDTPLAGPSTFGGGGRPRSVRGILKRGSLAENGLVAGGHYGANSGDHEDIAGTNGYTNREYPAGDNSRNMDLDEMLDNAYHQYYQGDHAPHEETAFVPRERTWSGVWHHEPGWVRSKTRRRSSAMGNHGPADRGNELGGPDYEPGEYPSLRLAQDGRASHGPHRKPGDQSTGNLSGPSSDRSDSPKSDTRDQSGSEGEAAGVAMRRGHQQTPYSLRSRINTPSRLSYASGFQPIEEGSREIVRATSPRTVRLGGPGAFPATDKRYSTRRRRQTAPSLGSPTVRQGIHDLDSDLMGPEHDQADSPLDRLSRHPYINPGSKRGRGGAMSLAAELGVEGSYDKTSSSDGRTSYDSDSLSDPELVAGRASGWWPTRGQLRRRVLRLIGSVSEKVSFCYLVVYFMLRESFYVLQKVLVLMLSRFIWRPMSRAGGALLFERRVLLLLCCVCAAGLAIFTSTTPTPTNVSDGAPRTHSLLGVKSWVRWWTRLDPSPFGSGTKLKPMTPEQREAFRELGSDAAFERIRQIEESLEELSRHISLHKLQSDEGRESLVQTLKELEREKDMLAHSSQQDAGRLAKLEQSITALRDESKAQRLEMEGMRRWWEASDQEIRKQGKGWSEVQRQVGMLLHDFDSFKRDISKQQGITKDQVRVVESAVAGMKVELQNFARQSGHRGERVGNVADESQSIQMLVSQMIESRLSGLASAQPGDAAHLRDFIRESLVQFANDRLGKADYALQSAGARIIPALTTDTLKVQPRKLIGQLLSKVGLLPNYAKPPATILSPDTHLGQCWPMAGSEGQVAIRLAAPVKVAEFGLEHVAKSLAIDVRSAPRDIEVLGYLVPDSGEGSTDQAELDQRVGDLVQLALYTYEPSDTSPLQTFPLLPEAQEHMKKAMVQTIILRVNSNWGHPDHTCIYRFRVHAV